MLWSVLEQEEGPVFAVGRGRRAYRSFLADPPSTWCGPRHHQRWSPLWRPLEGPLTPTALRQSLIILRSLFAFLTSQAYVRDNPFADLALPPNPQRPLGSSRTLSFAQWDHIDALLQGHVDTEPGRRLRRGMRWLYATGLRLAEITNAKCEDLEQVEYRTADGSIAHRLAAVRHRQGRAPPAGAGAGRVGRRARRRTGPAWLRAAGRGRRQPRHPCDGALRRPARRPAAWSASGLYQAIKAFLAQAADDLEGVDAQQLRKASTDDTMLLDGDGERLGKKGTFVGQHVYLPLHGVAVHINAYNFPVWGFLGKLAPALMAGVPVIAKPATQTCYVTQAAVRSIIDSGVLPEGVLLQLHLRSRRAICSTTSPARTSSPSPARGDRGPAPLASHDRVPVGAVQHRGRLAELGHPRPGRHPGHRGVRLVHRLRSSAR